MIIPWGKKARAHTERLWLSKREGASSAPDMRIALLLAYRQPRAARESTLQRPAGFATATESSALQIQLRRQRGSVRAWHVIIRENSEF